MRAVHAARYAKSSAPPEYEISSGTDPKTGEMLFPVRRDGKPVLCGKDLSEAKRFVRLMRLYGASDAKEP